MTMRIFYAEYIEVESEATPTPEATPTAAPTVTPEVTPSPTPTEAPMVKYVVRFYDWDGTTLLDEQSVMHGEAATPPADPVREGYKFVGWVPELSAITKDTIFLAQYEAGTAG